MTLQEALTILTTHQAWRLGAEIEMAEPKVITEALDVVLAYHHVGTNEMVEKNKTMTSVEWLEQKAKEFSIDLDLLDYFQQAKEMEKQQIIDAFDEGQEYEYQYHINNTPKFDSQTYYNETYGSKGSKTTSSQTTSDKWNEYQNWLNNKQ